MKRKRLGNLLANGTAYLFSVMLLLSMVAAPVVAVSSGWVTSTDIKDGTILTRDIKRDTINSSRIKDYSIRKEDIHSGSINKYKLISNSVNTYKIEDGSVKNQDMADGAVDSAKIADGSITNTDIADGASISDEKISYSTKTKTFSIVGAAFRPEDSPDAYDINSGSAYLVSLTAGDTYFFAPVHLPDGATVTQLHMNAVDAAVSYDAQARLYRRALDDSVTIMAETTTSGSAFLWQNYTDDSIDAPTIDNQNYQYYVRVRLRGEAGSNLRLGAASVTYTVAAP